MRSTLCALFVGVSALGLGLVALGSTGAAIVACDNSSSTYDDEKYDASFRPQIISVTGPVGGGVSCRPVDAGGNCPLPLKVTFRLPAGQYIAKAIVTFQGDGSDIGIDRFYAVPFTFGQDGTDVVLEIPAEVPTTILRTNALFTYTVRVITGAGSESIRTTLTVSVT